MGSKYWLGCERRKVYTPQEAVFESVLNSLGVPYIRERLVSVKDQFFYVDFFIPKYRVVFEIDGGYHEDSMQIEKDRERTRMIQKKYKWPIIRVPNRWVDDTRFCLADYINNVLHAKRNGTIKRFTNTRIQLDH